MTTVLNPRLVDEVRGSHHGFDASACMSCGVCTASCPMGIDVLPRRLFREVLLGMEDRVLEQTEAIYSCLLCKRCEVTCPAGVHITENVRAIRHFVGRKMFGV